MVLAILISLFFLQNTDPLLSSRYEKDINKGISKNLKLSDFDLKKISYENAELYAIKSEASCKGYLLIAEVAACNLGGCPSFKSIKNAKASEYFDLMVILDKDKVIKNLTVLDYFSDYGYEITSKAYLKKFRTKKLCEFSNQTDGIDAVSGATISSYALEGALSLLCDHFSFMEG